LRSGLITKTLSTSDLVKNSTATKPAGHCTYPTIISLFTTNWEKAWASLTLSPDMQIMGQVKEIMTT
jgi:hypothetical protein